MLSFFTVRIMAYICAGLGIVIVGLTLALWAQDVRLGKAQNDRDKARNQVTEALKTIKGQQTALQECSDRTDALKAEGLKRQAEADAAVATARKEAARYQQANQKRDAALRSPTPPGAGCREALVDLRRGLK